jgi:hypothetical protein
MEANNTGEECVRMTVDRSKNTIELELSEEQLDAVAGGSSKPSVSIDISVSVEDIAAFVNGFIEGAGETLRGER